MFLQIMMANNRNNRSMKVEEEISRRNVIRNVNQTSVPTLEQVLHAYKQNPQNASLRRDLMFLLLSPNEHITDDNAHLLYDLLSIADQEILRMIMQRREEGIDTWSIDIHFSQKNDMTPIQQVITSTEPGMTEFVHYLLNHGADPNQINSNRIPLLNLAEPTMISLLLQAGADPLSMHPGMKTTIFDDLDNWLYTESRRAMLSLLSQNINTRVHVGGSTRLQWLIYFYPKMRTSEYTAYQWQLAIKDVIQAGADLDIQHDKTGNTALHMILNMYPAKQGSDPHLDVILTQMIRKDARMDIENNNGYTAHRLIKKLKNPHLQEVIDRAQLPVSSQVVGKRPLSGGRRLVKRRQSVKGRRFTKGKRSTYKTTKQ